MQTIICKKCGAVIDARLGECPVCGAVYYIVPDDGNQSADQDKPVQNPGGTENIGDEDIFNTHVWKTTSQTPDEEDIDATRAFKPITPADERPLRPVAPTPTRAPSRPQFVASNASDKEDSQNKNNSAKKKLIIGAISLLALLTLVLTVMSGAFNFSDKTDEETMISLMGMTEETATAWLEGKELEVTVLHETSDELKDTVIDQSIKEGKKIKKGQSVTLTVSSGPEETEADEETKDKTVSVPPLANKSYDQALYELTNAGLLLAKAEDVYHDTVEKGNVVSQSPVAGTELNKGDIVTITLSKGPEPEPSPTMQSITALAGVGGSISPQGLTDVEEGGEMTFTITPDEGFVIREVKVDGTDVGDVSSYTFSNVTESHTIYAVFQLEIFSEE